MPKLYITRGLPGSGKSTLAREMVAKDSNLVRVNRDDLRKAQPKWVRGKLDFEIEKTVRIERDRLIREALNSGKDAINDDTNLPERTVKELVKIAKDCGASVEMLDLFEGPLAVPLNKCIQRDLLRDDSVGRDVIVKMWYSNTKIDSVDPQVLEYLPKAVICDLDGTLAHTGNRRKAYDENYDQDDVDPAVLAILESLKLSGHQIILLSGREGSKQGRESTLKWLDTHDILYDEFYMRAAGDRRDDTIVKRELYEAKIKFRYNVTTVFDDRKKVCYMWETLGLKVFRCGPDFDFDIAK